MDKKILIIAPNGGFGNRLRTMVNAIYLAKKLKMDIQHLWLGTEFKCTYDHIQYIHDKSFNNFFKSTIKGYDYINMKNTVKKVYSEWMPKKYWYSYQCYGQKLLTIDNICELNLVNEEMNNSEDFLIETTFINNLKINEEEKHKIYKNYFIPNDIFINKLELLPENTIGISIRRNEFLDYFPESEIDKNIIINWLSSIENPVLLFSDDREYQEEMRKYLKIPIIPNYESIPHEDNFFLGFLQLSKCLKLYGTYMSSFCQEAAYFGGVEYIPLKKDFFINY